jgi:hypothetical protein
VPVTDRPFDVPSRKSAFGEALQRVVGPEETVDLQRPLSLSAGCPVRHKVGAKTLTGCFALISLSARGTITASANGSWCKPSAVRLVVPSGSATTCVGDVQAPAGGRR